MNNNLLLSLTESIISRDFCVATYYVNLPPGSDPYEKAKNMAVGQTIGTWIPVPGITEEMRQNYMGKIVNIYDLQPDDLESPIPAGSGLEHYIFQIAYPVVVQEKILVALHNRARKKQPLAQIFLQKLFLQVLESQKTGHSDPLPEKMVDDRINFCVNIGVFFLHPVCQLP